MSQLKSLTGLCEAFMKRGARALNYQWIGVLRRSAMLILLCSATVGTAGASVYGNAHALDMPGSVDAIERSAFIRDRVNYVAGGYWSHTGGPKPAVLARLIPRGALCGIC